MSEEEEEEEELLVMEEREAEMAPSPAVAVAVAGDEPVTRKGFFLAPRRNPNGNPLVTPHSPKRYKSVSFSTLESPKILFKGWSSSLKQWDQWVNKLKPLHGDSWRKVGIFDAIIASTCRIRRDPCSLFGVSSFWCDETNTFLFLWGETTISLEDVTVLAGFPALGRPVRAPPLEGELKDLELRITEERLGFNRSSYKKPDHSAWLKRFVERGGDELEHVAFLSLWLSRFVFCSHPEKTIRQHVLPIAVRIARGERIALAPAVLAGIYRDLREVKEYLASNERSKEFPLIVWAPLHILQVWIWERFASLRPEANDSGNGGGPRMARWHEVGKKTELAFVQSVLNSPAEFQWRPYCTSLSDFSGDQANNEESRSFAVCLRDCELVGVDCIEQYLPHRVARQFGLDQDVPCTIPRANSKWEDAWESYEIKAKTSIFNFPRQLVESGVTLRYAKWWEQYRMACSSSNVVEDVKEGEEPAKNVKRSQEEKTAGKKKKKKGKVLLNGKKRKLADVYGATLSDWLMSNHRNVRAKNGVESHEPSTNAVEIRKKENLVEKPKENKKRKRAKGCEEKIHVKSQEPSLKAVEIKKKQTCPAKPKEKKKRKQANSVEEKNHVKSQEPSSNSVEIKKNQTVKPKENKQKKQAKGPEEKIEHKSRANVETGEGENISRGENSASNPLGEKEKAVKSSKKKNRVKSEETLQSAVKFPKQKTRAVEPKTGKKKEKKRARKEKIEIELKASGAITVEEGTPSGETYPSDLLAKHVKEMVERVAKLDVGERKEDGEARSPENGTVTLDVEEKVLIEERVPSGEAPPSDPMAENEKETVECVAEGDDREQQENEEDRSPERETVAGKIDEVLTEDGKKISDEEIAEDVEMMGNGESGCSLHIMQEPEEVIPLEQEKKREENEELTAVTGEEEKMIVEENGDCLCNPAVVEEPEEFIPLEKADQGGENMEIVDEGEEEKVVEDEEKRVDDRRTESEEALPTEETSQRGEKEKAVEKDEEEEVVEEGEKGVDDRRTESEEALPTEETSQRGEEKEKAVEKDKEEEVVKEEDKGVDDGRTESEEALPTEETSPRGEEKEIAVEKDEEEEVTKEEEKRIDDGRTESEEALPTEETSPRGEEKEIAVEKDEEVEEVTKEEEKRIDDGRTESEEALPTEETSRREEEKEITNNDIEEKEITSKDAEDKGIVEGVERANGGESPVCLSVIEDHETVALAEANNGEGEQEISEKSEEEEVIVEVINRITVVQEGEGEENGGTEEKADAQDIQGINNAGNPRDLALIKETVEDAEGTKDEEFASDRINSCNQLGQEREENTEEIKRTNKGESQNNPEIIKEREGTLTPEKEDRRRNDGDSFNLSLKDKEEKETLKNVNKEFKTESTIEVIVAEENKGMASSKHVKYEVERMEEKCSPHISKESKLEMEIRKLKEEIAAIEARVLDLESIADVQSRP
uniref:Aminotransferase-like plant mobile domain-containing protein n=1 Tax=Ananas comosus var. bracteatus TaxID=296719 RepID=A0A6V7QCY6_ANACO|nr:unnamed protein product [Ananas comosus var. bracteatus]